jgi:hypothetical protein
VAARSESEALNCRGPWGWLGSAAGPDGLPDPSHLRRGGNGQEETLDRAQVRSGTTWIAAPERSAAEPPQWTLCGRPCWCPGAGGNARKRTNRERLANPCWPERYKLSGCSPTIGVRPTHLRTDRSRATAPICFPTLSDGYAQTRDLGRKVNWPSSPQLQVTTERAWIWASKRAFPCPWRSAPTGAIGDMLAP